MWGIKSGDGKKRGLQCWERVEALGGKKKKSNQTNLGSFHDDFIDFLFIQALHSSFVIIEAHSKQKSIITRAVINFFHVVHSISWKQVLLERLNTWKKKK